MSWLVRLVVQRAQVTPLNEGSKSLSSKQRLSLRQIDCLKYLLRWLISLDDRLQGASSAASRLGD